MPRFLVPHKHGPHRVAAIALYKALTNGLRTTALPETTTTSLHTLIRARFKRNAKVASHRLLSGLFAQAYAVLDRLDTLHASSDRSDESHLQRNEAITWLNDYVTERRNAALLEQIAQLGTENIWKAQKAQRLEAFKRQNEPAGTKMGFPDPGRDLFSRPRPLHMLRAKQPPTETDGTPSSDSPEQVKSASVGVKRRRIPVLYSANRIPVLRFTKPQPRNLSRYLDNRLKVRQRRSDRFGRLTEMLSIAEQEDKWDAILSSSHGDGVLEHPAARPRGNRKKNEEEMNWAAPAKAAKNWVGSLMAGEAQRAIERTRQLVKIVDGEKALAKGERKARIMDRNRKAFERKFERKRREGTYFEAPTTSEGKAKK